MSISDCDFCKTNVEFVKVYDKWNVSNWLEAVDPKAGSDWLAIWCGDCGPKHRKK